MIKKLLFVVVTVVIVLCLVSTKLQADSSYRTVTDSTGTSSFTPTKIVKESVYGVDHEIVTGNAVTKGSNYGQYINEFEMKTDGFSSKLVSWAVATDNAIFSRQTIMKAAKDYEQKNPGWIVVAGINADQYWFSYGVDLGKDGSAIYEPAPYYPMIMNGDKVFTVTPYGNANSIVGFTNDGSVNSFVNPGVGAGGFYLSVLDDNGEVLKQFPVTGINQTAEANGTSVWCYHFSTRLYNTAVTQDVSTSASLYVVEDAELAYMSLYEDGTDKSYYPSYSGWPTNTIFAKGYISNDSSSSYTLDRGQFAIETNNAEVKAALANGVRIKVEQFYANEAMNTVDEGMGYHTVHRINGVDQECTGTYDSQHYSRSLFGRKADGTYVLMTADFVTGLGSYGMNWTECNALAKYYGVVDMYQMDGGGSVTAMVRQPDGSFKVTNYPKDSGNPLNPREDFSYLFFVVRDPGVRTLDENVTYRSVKLTKQDVSGSATISNIKVKLLGKTYDFDGEELLIEGLTEKTEYNLDVSYDITINGVTKTASYTQAFTTKAYQPPLNPIILKQAKKTSFIFEKPTSDVSANISNVIIHLGVDTYSMGSKDIYELENLIEDEEYEFYYEYDIYDAASDSTYHFASDPYTIKTLNYEEPALVLFEESSKTEDVLVISYKYTDPDKVVTNVVLIVNGEVYKEITTKSGTIRITDMDFVNKSYNIQLKLTYKVNGKEIVIESDVLQYQKTASDTPVDPVTPTTPENTDTKKKKCGKKSAELVISLISISSILAFVLKKRK